VRGIFNDKVNEWEVKNNYIRASNYQSVKAKRAVLGVVKGHSRQAAEPEVKLGRSKSHQVFRGFNLERDLLMENCENLQLDSDKTSERIKARFEEIQGMFDSKQLSRKSTEAPPPKKGTGSVVEVVK